MTPFSIPVLFLIITVALFAGYHDGSHNSSTGLYVLLTTLVAWVGWLICQS